MLERERLTVTSEEQFVEQPIDIGAAIFLVLMQKSILIEDSDNT